MGRIGLTVLRASSSRSPASLEFVHLLGLNPHHGVLERISKSNTHLGQRQNLWCNLPPERSQHPEGLHCAERYLSIWVTRPSSPSPKALLHHRHDGPIQSLCEEQNTAKSVLIGHNSRNILTANQKSATEPDLLLAHYRSRKSSPCILYWW